MAYPSAYIYIGSAGMPLDTPHAYTKPLHMVDLRNVFQGGGAYMDLVSYPAPSINENAFCVRGGWVRD